jgi:RNA polymerase sigma-70 factor, ECF subfamily
MVNTLAGVRVRPAIIFIGDMSSASPELETSTLQPAAIAGGDGRVVAALIRGDEGVYATLVCEYYPAMQRLAASHLHDGDAADDVIQETWIAVMKGVARFEGRSTLKTWIFRILFNLIRRRLTRERRFLALDDPATGGGGREGEGGTFTIADAVSLQQWDPARAADELVIGGETVAMVEAAVSTLPERQRDVITLRDIEGWTAEEVCEVLEISQANQRVLLHRARLGVRSKLWGVR